MEDRHPEYLFVEVSGSSRQKILVGVVYKPPNTGHLEDLEGELETLMAEFGNVVIMGDFNSDLNKRCFYGTQLRRFCSCLDLHLIGHRPTHHLENSESRIDVCIVDDLNKVLHADQSSQPFMSDHDLIFITYKYKIDKRRINCFTYRNWNAVDENLLQDLCLAVDTEAMQSCKTVNEMNSCLHRHLSHIIDMVAPEKTVYPRRPTAPWFTDEIKEL